MNRSLDFIIFGVPRSGTKGLVRSLNLHPHVYCAMERFHFRTDHSRLTFPASFVDDSTIHDQSDVAKIRRIRKELASKKEVRYAGNKLPRYYFGLCRINHEVSGLKNIWIYRSPYGFMPSWNRRELGSSRGQWPAGQVGLFGLLELLVCIENVLDLPKDVFVFPYEPGLGRSDEVVIQALDFLGADPSRYDAQAFERIQRRQQKKRLARKRNVSYGVALTDYEEELLNALHIRDLDLILNQGRGVMVSEIAAPLRDFLDRIASVLPEALDRAFSACDNPAVPSFGREYCRRYHGEIAGLLKRADGSKALVGFQRFGAYDRLKSLFVQRWRLRRRLGSMRLSGPA
jgi:hypothetical protein